MKYTEHKNPADFLNICRQVFEQNEALYGLMLGITLRLIKNPLHYGSQPLLATINSGSKINLVALMTQPYKLQIAVPDADPDEPVKLLCAALKENGWMIPGVMGEEKTVRAFETCWNKIAGTVSHDGMRQRLYMLQTVQQIQYPDGNLQQAKPEDIDLAINWGHAFYHDCFGETHPPVDIGDLSRAMIEEGNLFFWVNPEPVSMAGLTRPTSHGISVSYVYTPPQLRRKGYASAIVASLSRYALDQGREFCTLYTDLSNPTSNNIYQRIGYKPVADISDVVFSGKMNSEA